MAARFVDLVLGLAPLALLGACAEPGDLPSSPGLSIADHRSTASGTPSPQSYPLLAYDPVKDRVWQAGGFNTDGVLIYDLWTFSMRSRKWTQAHNGSGPTSWDAMALDARSRKLIFYQGYSAAFDAVDVETWAYDIETGVWENRHPAVQPPTRWGSMMVYDPRADRVLLYGGANFAEGVACGFCAETTVFGDLWAYDYQSNTWTQLHPTVSPPPHHFPVLEYVPAIDRVILFGGYQQGFSSLFNDTWAYDYHHNRWKNLKPDHPPTPRVYHYMALEPTTNRIVMFGGVLDESDYPNSPETPNNETWIYSVANNSWREVFPEHAPGPRAWHAMSRTSGPVLLFGGGETRTLVTNDTYLYSSRENEWQRVPGNGHDLAPEAAVATVGLTNGGQVFKGGPELHR
ncbi:MAG TPA: kelch repeat-containing protein [Gemmatimonadales bacterium]|nr:kelch repeat-containing protein [Gemmatimonadales bacterium]